MSNIKTEFKNKHAISPSRLDTLLECTAKYASKYLYKIPDSGNEGMFRGSCSHDVLEILARKRHKRHVDFVLANKSCKEIPSLWALIKKIAAKYNVSDKKNLDLIDSFIYTGLSVEFYGPEGTIEILTEKEFDFEVVNDNFNYRCKGIIDKAYIVNNKGKKYIIIRDFKSSKSKFDKIKIENNHQAFIYQLAIKRFLFPDIDLKSFDFIFLKFKDEPLQSASLLNDKQLEGYEHWLTSIQKKINNFSEKDISSNFAANNETLKMTRCGKEGFKKDGSPYFICQAQLPMDYYVLLNKKKEIIKSSHKLDLEIGEGESVEKRRYTGCRYFFDKNENRIRV